MKKKTSLFLLFIMFFFTLTLCFVGVSDAYFGKRCDVYLEKTVKKSLALIYAQVASEVSQKLEQQQIVYVEKKEDKVSAFYLNTSSTCEIIDMATKVVKENFIELEQKSQLKLAFGQIVSQTFFADWGPFIPITILPISSYHLDVIPQSSAFGINQTLYEVYLTLDLAVQAFIPLRSETISDNYQLCLASFVVPGDIPNFYFVGNKTNLE
jgi:sporulation protein YunB